MKERIARVIDLSYLQLVSVFIILVLLKELGTISPLFDYQIFVFILPLLALPVILSRKHSGTENTRSVLPLLLAAFLFALAIRLLLQSSSPVPQGYDPGFYKYIMDIYTSDLPQIPEADLANWVKEMHPQGLFILSGITSTINGTGSLEFISYLFPFLGAFLVFPVFIVTRSLFGRRAGLLASILYAISYTQFNVFNMFYFKNVLGLMFLLFSIYALEKRRYSLMAVMIAALGIFHRPEFLLFGLILIPYFILHRRKGIIFAVLGAAILILPFWIPRWEANWAVLSDTVGNAVANLQTGEGLGSGTFFDFATYSIVSIAYLPFAIMGALYLAVRRNWNSIFWYFSISLVITVFEILFFKRFIIPLDIACVILAAVGIEHTLLRRKKLQKAATVMILALLIVGGGIPTLNAATCATSLLTEQQLKTVEWMAENTEEDAYILATSYDAPWVLGWSERKIIAPGLFEWTVHDKEEWLDFLETDDPVVAEEFLDAYEGPVYIYYSQNPENHLNTEKFENHLFQKLHHEGALVYKYLGRSSI